MKIVKWFLIILAGIILIAVGIGFLMPGLNRTIDMEQHDFQKSWNELDKEKTGIVMIDHSTCLIRTKGMTILTDPWFTGGQAAFQRTIPIAITPDDLPEIDLILVTHNHWDHFDKAALQRLSAKKPDIPLFIPESNLQEADTLGFNRVIPATCWTTQAIDSVRITPAPLVHMTESVGYVIEGGKNIFFAGDTEGNDAYFDTIRELSEKYHIHVAILPSVGPKAFGGAIRTSLCEDNVIKTLEILAPEYMIPIHWGIKPNLMIQVAALVRLDGDPVGLAQQVSESGLPTSVNILGRGEGWMVE